LEAKTEAEALRKAATFRRLGMDFGTVRGPSVELSFEWATALGKEYVWTNVLGREFDAFCRQVNVQVEACARWGLKVGLHNHLGSPVESHEELVEFLDRCPGCGLILDTAHLAAAGGDPLEIVEKYPDRLVVMHLKDWLLTNPEIGLDQWPKRGRFCELGAGNIGLDNAAVMQAVVKSGYDGWVFIEHDTHLQDPLTDLEISMEYLRKAGF
jgi:sugar phosphate isomerase/epimerase